MMIQLANTKATYPCCQCSIGHGTVLPNPVPDQLHKVKLRIKADGITPDKRNLSTLTHRNAVIRTSARPTKPIAKPSNTHRSCWPK